MLRPGQHPPVVALIAVAAALGSTVSFWNRVLAYARREPTGAAKESER
jgi:hypothetical protein